MPASSRTRRADVHWIRRCRAARHGLVEAPHADAAAVVRHFGAVQAQDYAGAAWALGLRAAPLTRADVDRALDAGTILRTHVLRPTWHFVVPDDIRAWLSLTGRRIEASYAANLRFLELDPTTLTRASQVIERALVNGPLTRGEIATALGRRRIAARGSRLAFVVMHAELEGLIVSGPRRGRQFTYALLDQRAPDRREPREQALAALVLRYFTSHGPATIRDFSWWAGLPARDARAALDDLGDALARTAVDGIDYWHGADLGDPATASPDVWLLPNFDEYVVAYRDRAPTRGDDGADGMLRRSGTLPHPLMVGGRVSGSWSRKQSGDGTTVTVASAAPLGAPDRRRLRRAVERYSRFLGSPVEVRADGVS